MENNHAENNIYWYGKHRFAKTLLGDILSYLALADTTIALHDEERLHMSAIVVWKVAQALT